MRKRNFIAFVILSTVLLFSCHPPHENVETDYVAISSMCEDFLQEFYDATLGSHNAMDLSPYISNSNLCTYTNRKSEKASIPNDHFAVSCKVNDIGWVGKIDNPNIWDDEEWVAEVFSRAEIELMRQECRS